MAKLARTYIVDVKFPLADGTFLIRKVAENATSAKAAKAKVMKYYRKKSKYTKYGRVRRK